MKVATKVTKCSVISNINQLIGIECYQFTSTRIDYRFHQLPRPGIEGCSANVIIVITKQRVIIISNLHCVYQVVI